jgi:uncharacterized protein YbaR (Trm112 family)
MFTITQCPKCKQDFMYHNSDTHLRTKRGKVICQDCYEKQKKNLTTLKD